MSIRFSTQDFRSYRKRNENKHFTTQLKVRPFLSESYRLVLTSYFFESGSKTQKHDRKGRMKAYSRELKQPRQINSSVRASCFFVHFLDVHCPTSDVKPPSATIHGGREHTTMKFPFSVLIWIKS